MLNRKYFMRKIVVYILSTLLICLLIAIMEYTPGWGGLANNSFWGTYLVFLILVSPVYLIGGNIYSIVVDYIWSKSKFSNVIRVYQFIINVIVYGIGGCALLILYIFLLFKGNVMWFSTLFYLMGMLAGIIYCLLDSLIVRWNKVKE